MKMINRMGAAVIHGGALKTENDMKKVRHMVITMLLPLLCACLCACGESGKKEEGKKNSGILQMGCFYEDDLIVLSAPERFLYSEWDGGGFHSICTDPTCSHLSESCSARVFPESGMMENSLGLVYCDRLILLHSYAEHVDHDSQAAEGAKCFDISYVWHTDVYEADLDGQNRKYRSSFDGSIGSVNSAVLENGVLYFGGPIEIRRITEYDEKGAVLRDEALYSGAFYGVNLEDYSVRRFTETEGRDSLSYSYYVSVYDGDVYARVREAYLECGNWYRIDPETGECEEIMRFESDEPWFCGVVGDSVYYYYNNRPTLYAMDIGTKTEREVLRVEKDRSFLVASVLKDQIWVMTDYSMEEGNYMSEYTVLNAEGEAVDFYHFDEYLLFYGVVENRLIYSVSSFGEEVYWEEEMYWADLSDTANLRERSVLIGNADGEKNDPLLYRTNE